MSGTDRFAYGRTGGLRAAVRRGEPWMFPAAYVGWAYLWWFPIIRSDVSVWQGRNLAFFLIGGASPLLAGVALAWLTGGVARVRDLAWRLVDRTRIRARWWLVIVLFWPTFNVVMAAVALAVGLTDRPFALAWDAVADPGSLAFLLVLSFVFPAVEEVGLRGYYLDRLQERFSVTVASLINGATWAVWHAPFVLLPGYYASTSFQPELWWWLPKIVCDTVLIAWIYHHTRRSILAVLMFHALMNLTGELLGIAAELHPFLVLGSALAAAAAVTSWRHGAVTEPVGT